MSIDLKLVVMYVEENLEKNLLFKTFVKNVVLILSLKKLQQNLKDSVLDSAGLPCSSKVEREIAFGAMQ